MKTVPAVLILMLTCASLLASEATKPDTPKKTTAANDKASGEVPTIGTAGSKGQSKARSTATASRTPSRSHSLRPSGKAKRRGRLATKTRPRGQQVIESERAREIQAALIREKYLDGDATGIWDQRSKDAMMRFQNDNGWQSKVVPDSRALIKLGLGPKHANLLNPGSSSNAGLLPGTARDMRPGGAPPDR